MKSKNPFGNPRKHDPQALPKPPIAQAADRHDWVALISEKDAKTVQKAMKEMETAAPVVDEEIVLDDGGFFDLGEEQ